MVVSGVVDAVRDQGLPSPAAAGTVVERLNGLFRVGLLREYENLPNCSSFRIDADHRVARGLILPPQPSDVLELGIAIGMMPHRLFEPCDGRVSASSGADEWSVDRRACPSQLAAVTTRATTGWSKAHYAHGITRREFREDSRKLSSSVRMARSVAAVHPFFSHPSVRWILGFIQVLHALPDCFRIARQEPRHRTPPYPSFCRLPTAAYRRRSFSDNQPYKRCIFASTSTG